MHTQANLNKLIVALGALVAITPFAIDTYIPGLPLIADDLGVLTSDVERSVSLYVLGVAAGQLFSGPLSDRYGRKKVACLGLLLFLVASLVIALVETIVMLDLMRVIQALGGGVTVVTSSATVRDHFEGKEAARMITAIGMVMLVAPLIAPAVGRLLIYLGGWRLIFVCLAVYAVVLIYIVVSVLPTPREAPVSEHLGKGIWSRWGRVFRYAPGPWLILANGFSFAAIFAFITDSAFFYLEFYQVGDNLFPFYFGANVVAMIAFNRLNVRLLHHFEAPAIMAGGLIALWISSVLLVGQFLVVDKPSLWTVTPNIMLTGGLVALVMPNGIASLLHLFPSDSGTASGLNGSGQFLIAGLSGVVLVAFHNGSPLPMVLTMLLSATLAGIARLLAGRNIDLMEIAPGQ